MIHRSVRKEQDVTAWVRAESVSLFQAFVHRDTLLAVLMMSVLSDGSKMTGHAERTVSARAVFAKGEYVRKELVLIMMTAVVK